MKNVTIEELMKDEFFQQKVKEIKNDEELSALLQNYRIVFPEDEASAEGNSSSKAAEKMAELFSKLGYEVSAADMQDAINASVPVDEGELDESALEEVAGGILPIRVPRCRRVCYRILKRQICTYICF